MSRAARQTRAMADGPDLLFPPGELAGFTAAGVAAHQDLHPAAVVRELLQNSLDAAREAGRGTVQVRFEVEEHSLRDVPGMVAYRKAYRAAVSDQKKRSGTLPGQAALVAQSIDQCLKENRCTSLFVFDDGIGLNDERMTGLLADGMSVKGDAGAGAFGNGHFVVMPASDLRYVLYGGRTGDGSRIAAGHAILASHNGADGPRGKDGYFVSGERDDLFRRFDYPQGGAVPPYLGQKLARLAELSPHGAGTVVAVPGFNRFRDPDATLWDAVAQAAACSFFPAIHAGAMTVEVVEAGASRMLDPGSLPQTLVQFSEEKRARSKFLSGSRAWGAFETISLGREHTVGTEAGDIRLRLREAPEGGISRLDLCRNGMWITDDIPNLRRTRFGNRRPFHCVLLIDARDGSEVHTLVRGAEGPLHNNLVPKRLTPDDRKKLKRAMETVAAFIERTIPAFDGDSFTVSDVFTIETRGIEAGGRRPVRAGYFERVPRRDPAAAAGSDGQPDSQAWNHDGSKSKEWRNPRNRPAGRPLRFRALAVQTARRACAVELRPEEACPDSEVRFALDESIDESCDGMQRETYVRLSNVTVDGVPVSPTALTGGEDGVALGVALGRLEAGAGRRITFEFAVPDALKIRDEAAVVLKTQVFRGAPSRGEAAKKADGPHDA